MISVNRTLSYLNENDIICQLIREREMHRGPNIQLHQFYSGYSVIHVDVIFFLFIERRKTLVYYYVYRMNKEQLFVASEFRRHKSND